MSSDPPRIEPTGAPGELAVLGRLIKPFGVRGEMGFRPSADDPEWYFDIDPDRVYLLCVNTPPRRLRTRFRRRQGGVLIVKFEGVDTPEDARKLNGCELAIPEADRPALDEGEFYADELIGCVVLNPDETELGRIAAVVESPSQTFLSVRGESGEFLLPPDPALYDDVDLEGRRIRLRVRLGEGSRKKT